MKRIILFALMFGILLAPGAQALTPTEWDYYYPIDINSTQAETDYTVWLNISSADVNLSLMQPDGADLRFTDSSDNELDYWLEKVTTTQVWAYVDVATISSTIKLFIHNNTPVSTTANIVNVGYIGDNFSVDTETSGKWIDEQGNFFINSTGWLNGAENAGGAEELFMHSVNMSVNDNYTAETWFHCYTYTSDDRMFLAFNEECKPSCNDNHYYPCWYLDENDQLHADYGVSQVAAAMDTGITYLGRWD